MKCGSAASGGDAPRSPGPGDVVPPGRRLPSTHEPVCAWCLRVSGDSARRRGSEDRPHGRRHAEREVPAMSEEGRSTPPQPPLPQSYAPASYEDQRSSRGGRGWLVAVGLVFAFAVGGLAAAIISKGDDANTPAPSTVVQQNTTTVTAPAPDVTLAPDGTPAPIEGGSTADGGSAPTDTSQSATTTASP